jgi:hypothetical protein
MNDDMIAVIHSYLDIKPNLDVRGKCEIGSQAAALIRGGWSATEASAAARAFARVDGSPKDFAWWASRRRGQFRNYWSDR